MPRRSSSPSASSMASWPSGHANMRRPSSMSASSMSSSSSVTSGSASLPLGLEGRKSSQIGVGILIPQMQPQQSQAGSTQTSKHMDHARSRICKEYHALRRSSLPCYPTFVRSPLRRHAKLNTPYLTLLQQIELEEDVMDAQLVNEQAVELANTDLDSPFQ